MLVTLLRLLRLGSWRRVLLRASEKSRTSLPVTLDLEITITMLLPWSMLNSRLTMSWAMLDSEFFGLNAVSV
jgi:hypothetical protein